MGYEPYESPKEAPPAPSYRRGEPWAIALLSVLNLVVCSMLLTHDCPGPPPHKCAVYCTVVHHKTPGLARVTVPPEVPIEVRGVTVLPCDLFHGEDAQIVEPTVVSTGPGVFHITRCGEVTRAHCPDPNCTHEWKPKAKPKPKTLRIGPRLDLQVLRDSLPIKELRVGQSGYTVPWAMHVDRDGRGWLDPEYTVEQKPTPTGTLSMLVTRTPAGYYLKLSFPYARQFEWNTWRGTDYDAVERQKAADKIRADTWIPVAGVIR